jgi:phage shock protein E
MRMKWLIISMVILVGSVGLLRAETLSREEVQALRAKGAVVIDVRTPEEYKAGHLEGVINAPLAEISQKIGKLSPDKSRPILLHCRSGARSEKARDLLVKSGYKDVRNLGGLEDARRLLEPPAK